MDLLNKVMLIGNLTGDPEVRTTGNGTSVAALRLAVDAPKPKDGSDPTTTFVDIVVWEKLAENAGKYLAKGQSVLIEGRLHLDQWTDRQSGDARQKLKVVGERMRFLNPPSRDANQRENRPQPSQQN